MTRTVLETERLILRRPAPRDWEGYAGWCTSPRAQYAGGQSDLAGAWRSFAAELGHWEIRGYGMWTVTVKGGDDTGIGLVGPWYPIDWPEREVGWLIWEDFEGKGYAREAARAAVDHAFTDLGWDTVVSYIAEANARSITLAERLGAVLDPAATPPKSGTLVYRHTPEGTMR